MNKRELIELLRGKWGIAVRTSNNDVISYLRFDETMTFQEIGDIFGVSRQRIHQIASNPRWTGITGRPRKDERD